MKIEGTAVADLMRIVTASTYPWRCISSARRPPDKNSFRIFKEEYRKDECAQIPAWLGPFSIFHRCTIVVINAPEAFGGISLGGAEEVHKKEEEGRRLSRPQVF